MPKSAPRWKRGGSSLKDFKAEAETLFDQATMAALADHLNLPDPDVVASFRASLIEHCAHYREVISTLPCDLQRAGAPPNMTLTKRVRWLETNVIGPASKLIEAIGNDNVPMFSTWPYPLTIPEFRDNSTLAAELTDILHHATNLRDSLRGQQEGDAAHSQELRAEIFCSMARTFRQHAPHVPPSRGEYDEKEGKRRGFYLDAMRLVFKRIINEDENLDRLIASEMRMPS